MSDEKAYFAAVPARAYGDARLTGIHLRALGIVALHDRMAQVRGKGAGCWASRKTLAQEIGCNYSNLSTALTELGAWGYISRKPNPLSKKQTVLHVIYNDQDAKFVRRRMDENALPTGKRSETNSSPTDKPGAEIVCLDFGKTAESQSPLEDKYIPQSGEENSAEAEKNSLESAPPCGSAISEKREIAQYLRKIETVLKDTEGRKLTKGEADYFAHHAAKCAAIEADYLEVDTDQAQRNLGYQAQRLASEIGWKIEVGA